MSEPTTEALFVQYRARGDAEALAAVFDRLAPQLLLVAARLAGGAVAEDLVQATFLDAIRQRDRWDAARPFAPWLVGLLGNHVRRARRERARMPEARRLPVREVERPEAVLEANECAAAVHAAVERLPRHYRQVLSLRLVHGLELQQIAHSLDLPLGTVKVRLHRGMDLLRRTLPAGLATALAVVLSPGVGLAAVRQVVVGNAGAAVGATAVGVGVGVLGILGGLMMKQVVIAVAVVVVLVGAWFAVDAAQAGPGAAVPAEHAGAAVAAPLPDAAKPLTKEVVKADADAAAVVADAFVREVVPTTGGLDVQVVWAADGAPAAGVFVRASTRGAATIPRQPTDAGGKVAFVGLAAGSYRVVATGLDRNVVETADVVVGETRACRLAIEGDVRVKFVVVDGAGTPQVGATVATEDGWHAYGADDVHTLGTSDAAGIVHYRGLPIQVAWAQRPGRQPSPQCTALPRADQSRSPDAAEVRLVLGDAGCVVTGTVVDPRGQPVPKAQVFIACEDELVTGAKRRALCVQSDAQGRFACDQVPAGERTIVASGAGFAPRVQRITTSLDAPTSTTLVLQVGAMLSGRVTDQRGQPIAKVQVSTGPSHYLPGIDVPWGAGRTGRTDGDGRYRLEALMPGETHARVAIEPSAEQQFVLADGEQKVWDVEKPVERCIRGSVLGPDGEPLRGWRVEVRAAQPTSLGRSVMAGGITSTEAGGRFEVPGLEDTTYRLFVLAMAGKGRDQFGGAAMVPRAILENVRPSPTEITIRIDAAGMASGWLEGALSLPAGLHVKAELSLYPKALSGGVFSVPKQHLDAGVTTFRFGPLPAGEYDLLCDLEGRGRLSQHGIQLAPNATLQLPPFAFDAQRPVQLVLRQADGRPVIGADVKLRPDLTPCHETSPGQYESLPVAVGTYEAVVRGPDCAPCTFAIEFHGDDKPLERTVAPGTAVQFVLQPTTPRERWIGALQVFVTDAAGTRVVSDMVQIDGKNEFVWPLGLAPGTYSIRATVSGEGQATATFTVGTTPLRVELPLAK